MFGGRFNSRFWYWMICLALAMGVLIFLKNKFPQELWDALKSTYMQDGTEVQGE